MALLKLVCSRGWLKHIFKTRTILSQLSQCLTCCYCLNIKAFTTTLAPCFPTCCHVPLMMIMVSLSETLIKTSTKIFLYALNHGVLSQKQNSNYGIHHNRSFQLLPENTHIQKYTHTQNHYYWVVKDTVTIDASVFSLHSVHTHFFFKAAGIDAVS